LQVSKNLTSGEVRIKGEVVNQRKPYERNVSTVFQSYALFPHLSARGNVEFGLKRHGMSDIENRVAEAIKLVGLIGKEVRRPTQLPVVSASGLRWPGRWFLRRTFYFWMSRWQPSTPSCANKCAPS